MGKNRLSAVLFWALAWCSVHSEAVFPADEPPVGVVYPQVREPYHSVFKAIVSGVRSGASRSVAQYEIDNGAEPSALNRWVAEHRIATLVSLGSKGLEACRGLPGDVRVVFGAVLAPSGAIDQCAIYGGISLAPAPGYMFEQLKKLSPAVSEVTVVYSAVRNRWLIEHAVKAAEASGLRLHAVPAETLSEAAQIYRERVESGIGAKHAIWLLQDSVTVDQSIVLPMLLKESWNHGFVVFSSNAAHVKRGVLFALYPDYKSLGTRLGRMAMDASHSGAKPVKDPAIQPLTDVLVAVNLRTADHLKLNLTNSQIEAFDLTFPATR